MTTQPTNRAPLIDIPRSMDVYIPLGKIFDRMTKTMNIKEDKTRLTEVLIHALKQRENNYTRFQVVDAFADMVVFGVGSINKFGGQAYRDISTDPKEKQMYKSIIDWNNERKLIKPVGQADISNEISFVVEEMLEAVTDMESSEARQHAKILTGSIISKEFKDNLCTYDEVIEMYKDIITIAKEAIFELEFDYLLVMEQVQTEIDSRVGSIIDGKFVKDKSEEAQANWYKSDFSKCYR